MSDINQSDRVAESGAAVQLDGVTKRFGDLTAVDDLTLSVPAGSFVSLLGPSGCGKSTTLRMIAGFERPDSGRVLIGDRDVTRMEARRRPTAMVFQNYALFPHMTVSENVAYGLKVRKMEKSRLKKRVSEVLARVDMTEFSQSPVTELSGGQQQRAALARAVAVEPEVLLFDEPLSNLDVALRHQTRRELKQLQHRLGLTSVYVTHDQEEALSLSDRVAVMRRGRVIQIGTPQQLYRKPDTAFVASFLGGANILPEEGVRRASGEISDIKLPETGSVLAVRAEDIHLTETGPFSAKVRSVQFLGAVTEVILEWDGIRLRSVVKGEMPANDTVRFAITTVRSVIDDLD